jgi:hypothetical protein
MDLRTALSALCPSSDANSGCTMLALVLTESALSALSMLFGGLGIFFLY